MAEIKISQDDYDDYSSEQELCNDLDEEEMEFRNGLYEKSLASCGFGWFHVVLFLVCGWALASDSAEIQVVSFVAPTACDLDMTSSQKGWLNAIIFVGMMVGGYLLGGLADVKGRRYVLLWSLSINGLFGLLSAFAPTFTWFLLLRFLSGIGVGAAMPVIFSYCAEFVDTKRRGPLVGVLACFWMVGNIMTCGIAWLILPNAEIGGWINLGRPIYFGSWRLFVVVGAVPSLTSALFMFFMPESPMFLEKHGRYEEAHDVFMRIFRRNFGRNAPMPDEIEQYSDYYNTYMKISGDGPKCEDKSNSQDICMLGLRGQLAKMVIKVVRSTGKLFVKPYGSTTIMLVIIWYTLSFGYYGLWMWFPEIFKRMESEGGSTCTGASNAAPNITSNLTCWDLARETSVYMQSLLVALSNIPGNLLTIAIVNKLGRRALLALSMILSAVSVFFFSLVRNRIEMIVMSCIFSGMSVAGWNVLDMLSMENYPTQLRSTAFGLQSAFGRIAAICGNVAFGAMVDENCAVPLLIVAVLLSIGGLIALKLPKTDYSPLT